MKVDGFLILIFKKKVIFKAEFNSAFFMDAIVITIHLFAEMIAYKLSN